MRVKAYLAVIVSDKYRTWVDLDTKAILTSGDRQKKKLSKQEYQKLKRAFSL